MADGRLRQWYPRVLAARCKPRSDALERPFPVNYSAPLGGLLAPARRSSPEGPRFWLLAQDSYLVDSASSHMLVSKIKPCMSKYKQSIL